MKHHRNTLDDRIKEARRAKRAAASALRRVCRQVQAECPHDRVLHADYKPGNWLGGMEPHRLCARCGLEESGWSFTKLTTDFVKVVSHDTIFMSRP